jgi:hypothetical protein
MMEKMEAERKAYEEKMIAKRKADREEVAARLEAIHDKTDANQMRLEPKTEHQEMMDAWMADMKDDRKERTSCQEAMEPNPGEMETVVKQQEIPNEEEAIHSLRAY